MLDPEGSNEGAALQHTKLFKYTNIPSPVKQTQVYNKIIIIMRQKLDNSLFNSN